MLPTPLYGNVMDAGLLRYLIPYFSEANYWAEQDFHERSTDDTVDNKNKSVLDHMPTEENRNNTMKENAPAPFIAVVPRRAARTNKGVLPLRYGIYDPIV